MDRPGDEGLPQHQDDGVPEGADYVFVAIATDEGLIATKRFLDVGIGSGNDMLIEGGLEFGDQVVSIGGSRIVEGQRIRAISE